MRGETSIGLSGVAALGLLCGVSLVGCKDAADEIEDIFTSEVTGQVTDNHGQPVPGSSVRLYNLLDNTDFVEGSDISSAEAYIDREAVLASTNTVDTTQTGDDGRFVFDGLAPTAFLAVATSEACTAGFAGFDEETGVLNVDTLITPHFDNGLSFEIPAFVVACATAPDVGPDGNSSEAPVYEPPGSIPCDAATCMAAGGTCAGGACQISCSRASCAESGGTCVAGECTLPACDAAACGNAGGTCMQDVCVLPTCNDAACADAGGSCNAGACVMAACNVTECSMAGGTCNAAMTACDIPACTAAEADCLAAQGTCSADGETCVIPPCLAAEPACTMAGGSCSTDGSVCQLPACMSDADCQAGQPGAICVNPGDVALAACEPPASGEIVPPEMATGWTGLRVTDTSGKVLADASTGNQVIATADIPADGLVRVYGDYAGSATTGYIQVQSGGQNCPNLPPHTDFIAAEIAGGGLASGAGNWVDLVLHGGYEKILLSTSDVLGEGEQSFAVEVGDACTPPEHPFVAILSWEAGPSQPADLDLSVWNAAGELVFVGNKQAAWGQLALEGKGPGPEVFEADDVSQGPFTVKVQFFSGKPRDIEGRVRILRTVGGQALDETFIFHVDHPKDVAEIGVFPSE
jgi:hypothetical protein